MMEKLQVKNYFAEKLSKPVLRFTGARYQLHFQVAFNLGQGFSKNLAL